MLTDRYGLAVTSGFADARDAYVEGCDLLLTVYPGAIAAFDRAIALDPGFVLAWIATARTHQLRGDFSAARSALAWAEQLVSGSHPRAASQIAIFRRLFAGQIADALTLVRAHLDEWPRDALILSTTANQGGLIGMSGLAGREHELAGFLAGLAPYYGDDWWFNAHYGMALSETSQQAAALPIIEQSLARNPRNAFAAHARAHLYYESGERDSAVAFLHSWMPSYSRDGGLYGHLNWHLALFELQAGNVSEGFRLYTEAFAAEDYRASPMLKLVDASSFLWRSELAGHPREPARWLALHDFAQQMFPQPGTPMADWHVALAFAAVGGSDAVEARARQMDEMVRTGCYPCGSSVPAVARAFAAFQRDDFPAVIDLIEPMLSERERIGGSRAQVDLVEFTLMRAYLATSRFDDARRLLRQRRPGPTRIPVAGLALMH